MSNGRRLALLLAVAGMAAQADPVRTDPAPNVTVFTDEGGAHVVTLVEATGAFFAVDVSKVIDPKNNGRVHQRNVANAIFSLGHKSYWVRTRFVDGRLICEKFGWRPKTDEERAAWADALFKESCS